MPVPAALCSYYRTAHLRSGHGKERLRQPPVYLEDYLTRSRLLTMKADVVELGV